MASSKVTVALKFLAAVPLALFVGGVGFRILAEGTWIFVAIFAFLPDIVFAVISGSALVLCWVAAFVVIVKIWVFEKNS